HTPALTKPRTPPTPHCGMKTRVSPVPHPCKPPTKSGRCRAVSSGYESPATTTGPQRHHERTSTMTTTAVAPATSTITAAIPTAPTTWVSVAEGLWVGSSTGEFRGTIEFVDGRFETSDD